MTNRRFFTFILALLIAASTALVSCSSDKENGDGSDTAGSDSAGQKVEQNLPVGEDTTDVQSDTAAPAPVITEPPANEVDDVPTDDPSSDIPAVEMPGEDPAVTEPEETPKQNNEPDDGSVIPEPEQGALAGLAGQTDSGRFTSEQSPNLVLCIDWESVIGEDGTADVTVTVGISHYRLFAREKFEMGAIQVDGNAVKFSTPKIEYDENTKTFTEFFTATYETTRSEMEVEASWQVLGKYGDIEIDTLTAGGTIVLADNS